MSISKRLRHVHAGLIGIIFFAGAGGALPAGSAADRPDFVRITPADVHWQDIPGGHGAQQAVLLGDPDKPGIYVIRAKFPPHVMDRPHSHPNARYVTVLEGTWYTGTGDTFDPARAVPLPPGSIMMHPARAVHWDGSAGDETVIVQIIGNGPGDTTPVDASKPFWIETPTPASPPVGASAATPLPSPPPPPPLKIDLNAFDASKKTIALPNGESLAYIDMGERSGPAVVLIHGYTDSARDWVPMLPYLSKRFRLILVDIRGHGQSAKPECCYTRLDFAYDIKLLLDALGVGKADVVGHSLGSIIAQTFAEYWPERTARVVLISSTGGAPPDRPKRAPQFDFAAEIRKLKEPIDADSPFMIAWWDSPTPVDPDFLRRQRKDAAGIPLRVWLAVLDQALPANTTFADLQSTLPRLKAPALLIWGSQDPIMEEDVRRSLRDALPHAKVKVFDGLGHNPFWEDPRGVADVINHFLDATT